MTFEILDVSDDAKRAEYEALFYAAFARVTTNRLVHELWAWDYGQKRVATHIPYQDQIICALRDDEGSLHTAIAFNTALRQFQSSYFGFAPPQPADGCFEVLTFFSADRLSPPLFGDFRRHCRPVLLDAGFCTGYATTARRPMQMYVRAGWELLEEKEITGEMRYFLRYALNGKPQE